LLVSGRSRQPDFGTVDKVVSPVRISAPAFSERPSREEWKLVILQKGLDERTLRFLQAAELIGGPGHGWATRFVATVEMAATASPGQAAPPAFPKVSVSRIHNLLNGHRQVTPALETLVLRLAEPAATRMEADAARLRLLHAAIEAG
jgi:hypothetical protein